MQDIQDQKILEILISQGRITWAELGNLLGLSAPASADRVRRMEEKGIIKGYTALINHKSLGYSLMAFVTLSLSHPKHKQRLLDFVKEYPEVQECYHTLGCDDYLMKIRCHHTEHLDLFLNENLKILPGVSNVKTTIILASVKEPNSILIKKIAATNENLK
jgi:Lrp/AsnC family leucine-responsive transcriptional regulator